MICQDCKDGYHEVCKGATHCPCQHRVPTIEVPLKSGGVLVLRATTEDRPQRKSLVELVTDGTYTTEAEVTKAALVELTQLAQEMGLE